MDLWRKLQLWSCSTKRWAGPGTAAAACARWGKRRRATRANLFQSTQARTSPETSQRWRTGRRKSMSKPPKIAVVIPCFNNGEFLREAVDSVLRAKRDDMDLIV